MKYEKLILSVFAFFIISTTALYAKEVVIVTSFPKELFETYKKAFEAKNPGITVVINSKQTNAGVTYLRETKAKPEADIFWVSAPDAFQTLKAEGLLEKYAPPKEIMPKIPPRSGLFPSMIRMAPTSASPSAVTASCGTKTTSRPTNCPRPRSGPISPIRNITVTW